jgi:hypothetical protein
LANFKKEHKEIARRDRIFKTAWRHGIVGIDNADSGNSSIFYKDEKARRDFAQKEKDTVNMKRKDSKYKFVYLVNQILIYFNSIAELGIFFGTSAQMPVSSDNFKRTKSLLQAKPEVVVDINDLWKNKAQVPGAFGSLSSLDTYSRFCLPASNVDRTNEDGCMKKIRLERSLKLRREDLRGRSYNILTNKETFESDWLNSFGAQKEALFDTFAPKI